MPRNLMISFFAGSSLLSACSTPSVVTTWKLLQADPQRIETVLIVGVIHEDSTITRTMVEKDFCAELKKAGYQAPGAMATFGAKGLANLPREQTLLRLCNNGIDAVLTIALVDDAKEKFNSPPKTGGYAANFYLDRIWNYSTIGADLQNASDSTGRNSYWEIILFDLYTLQPLCALQAKSFGIGKDGQVNPELAKRIVSRLIKQKLIRKRNDQKKNQAVIAVKQPAT